MKKADLRKLYLQKMRSLSKEEHEKSSQLIAHHFLSYFNLKEYSSLHTFFPIEKNNEINTRIIIEGALKINPDIKIIIPRCDFESLEMSAHHWQEGMNMSANSSGILELVSDEYFDEKNIDIILLPLLAFDEKGYRAGYGKGFYDRFLKKCREDVIKAGLSLFPPVESIEDTHSNDVQMDYCVTPEGVNPFLNKSR